MSITAKNTSAATRTLSFGIRTIARDLNELPLSPALAIVPVGLNTLEEHHSAPSSHQKIMLPTMEGISFEKVKHIQYLEASGNYTMIHFTDGRQILVCRSLCEIEARLPTDAFVRIHRSHTIHLNHLKKYVRGKGGHVVLDNGVLLTVSAGQKDHFLTVLDKYFS